MNDNKNIKNQTKDLKKDQDQNGNTAVNPTTDTQAVTDQAKNHPAVTVFDNATISEVAQVLEQQGLHGLVTDYASFPIICLKGKTFEMTDEEDFNPAYFDVTILKTQEKHILVDLNDSDFADVRYSSDGIVTNDGEILASIKDNMREAGRNPSVKRYLDVLVQLHTEDKHDKKLAVLSISPTSVSRISGFFHQLAIQGKLANLHNQIIRVSKGQQKTSRGGQAYRLWKFELMDEVKQAA